MASALAMALIDPGSIDWMAKTSSLDPEERVVTQHL